MNITISKVAEKQLIEIEYAFGCGHGKAVSHALESMNAYEEITGNQIINYLITHHEKEFIEWEKKNEGKRAKLENN